ncbi:MAG TPA: 50S ribosomal protein L18 [Roseimicrobium sp.]|nr:50S ribosomal protein L18 [Roseimicrobium sp.]
MRTQKKVELAKLRRWRIRKKVVGTSVRPRMSVRFTGKNIHVQFIDDGAGLTLASASTLAKSIADRDQLGANVKSAQIIGKVAAEAAIAKGIKQVVFDRSGARYHGKVKALAEAARTAGLQF